MKKSRPGILAVRTVNDYRRRDVFGFLGVRYYLESSVSRSDEWARRVATTLAITKSKPAYFTAEHFKDYTEQSGIEHRSLFIPGPNECVAEEVLLAECAKHKKVFDNPDCVYSYALSDPTSRNGAFLPYMIGLRKRQADIAKACEATPNGVVLYTDIKKFYPSVSVELARAAWTKHCGQARLTKELVRLGECLIEGHATSGLQGKSALLTGPMFSHLLANLVFRDLDREMSNILPATYFRYVDDITLVGERSDVARALDVVKERCSSLGLELHGEGSPKTMEVLCQAWLPSRHDFSDKSHPQSWMRLVGSLKRFLLQHSEQSELLHEALIQEGFRIPVRDYSTVIREQDFTSRIIQLAPWNWFRRKAQGISLQSIGDLAKELRSRFDNEFQQLLQGAEELAGYERKRRLSKLRYCIARLVYLAPEDRLLSLSSEAASIPELFFHTEIMKAVASRNIDRVLAMGTNAAQATAQPLRAIGTEALATSITFQKAKEQSLAVFLMNGVVVQRPQSFQDEESQLIRFANVGADRGMMKSENAFIREVACLHGIAERPRHTGVFEIAFDEDEALSMDAVTQLQQSVS